MEQGKLSQFEKTTQIDQNGYIFIQPLCDFLSHYNDSAHSLAKQKSPAITPGF
jgi:hypothetical protein